MSSLNEMLATSCQLGYLRSGLTQFSQNPGWCSTTIALLLRAELVSVLAPYKKICQLRKS